MKAAIVYLCMGSYKIFWKDFYSSAEKYFLPNIEKSYFVFTEAEEILQANIKRVYTYYQKKIGWPYDTLLRFDFIARIQDILIEYDLIYFCNANLLFLDLFGENIIDVRKMMFLTCWPDTVSSSQFSFERNPKSKAYIPLEKECPHYIQGGFFGGPSDEFLEMNRILRDWIAIDIRNGIIPVWHDESMLNAYLCDKKYTLLPLGVMMLEDRPLSNTIAIFRDKEKHGGSLVLRYGLWKGTRLRIKRLYKKIIKKLFN